MMFSAYKKRTTHVLMEAVLLFSWIGYVVYFSAPYQEAIFYMGQQSSWLHQIFFVTEFYLNELLQALVLFFVLLTLTILLALFFKLKHSQQKNSDKGIQVQAVVSFILGLAVSVLVLTTVLWPLFLLLEFLSLVVVYSIYAITKHIYGDREEVYQAGDVVKKKDGFPTIDAAKQYQEEFVQNWTSYFYDRGFELISAIQKEEHETFSVQVTLQPMKQIVK